MYWFKNTKFFVKWKNKTSTYPQLSLSLTVLRQKLSLTPYL